MARIRQNSLSRPKRLISFAGLLFLCACESTPMPPIPGNNTPIQADNADRRDIGSSQLEPRTEEEIRKAYTEYLKNAGLDEQTRLNALTRLAELEYGAGNILMRPNSDDEETSQDSVEYQHYLERLQRSADLLSTSLNDFPDAGGNDSLLYQLAKAQAQIDLHAESFESLNRLVANYPKSHFYTEAQFRIAEEAFSQQHYSAAEYAYSEVILAPDNEIFYEKALFKRGWARFKQQYYPDAIDDFVKAVLDHEFGVFETLTPSEEEQFNEYFRAIALSFSYLNDSEILASYFKNQPGFPYTYHSYRTIGDLYLRQERYSDAVDTHRQFITHFPASEDIPYSYLKIIEIWKESGFEQQIYQAIDDFYANYNPSGDYWANQNENSKVNRAIRRSLREYLVLITAHFHSRYQSNGEAGDAGSADKWYQRYLKFYADYARQDNIFYLYGELLSQANRPEEALANYEQAAFDNELILHKEAAYAAVIVSDTLYSSTHKTEFLEKILTYTNRFTLGYPKDGRTHKMARHAAEQAYRAERYRTTIELADIAIVGGRQESTNYLDELRASSYFALDEFEEAEAIYRKLLQPNLGAANKQVQYRNYLSLAIYKQGEKAGEDNDLVRSVHHFSRISSLVPGSRYAATGLYDAIAINIQNKQWADAISLIERFQRLYPKHDLRVDVSKKLSFAYLSSDQGIKAAREFEKLARLDSNYEAGAAALWKAAELYEEKNKTADAIKAYRNYASGFKKNHTQLLEAMFKLGRLHATGGSVGNSLEWYGKITRVDGKALNNIRTERSRFITSSAYLELARHEKTAFDEVKLALPLNTSLKKKKKAMEKSVGLFGKASLNKNYRITTEATYSIARIYRDFSQALLDSDRPGNLNEDELDQYEILLEDQAFRFEDKSIGFFEINLARISNGLYDDWIRKSHQELVTLFPVRYGRKPKVDDYIAILE